MNCVAPAARHLPFCVSALNPSGVGRLIQMAGKAHLVRLCCAKLCRVTNVLSGGRFGVLARGAVTRFASLSNAAVLLFGFDRMMSTLTERSEDVLVARLTDLRTDILGRFHRFRLRLLTVNHKVEGAYEDNCPAPSESSVDAITAHASSRRRTESLVRGRYRSSRPGCSY